MIKIEKDSAVGVKELSESYEAHVWLLKQAREQRDRAERINGELAGYLWNMMVQHWGPPPYPRNKLMARLETRLLELGHTFKPWQDDE